MMAHSEDIKRAIEALFSWALDPAEEERLVTTLADSRANEGFSEHEAAVLVAWSRRVRVDNTLLQLLLDQHIHCDVTPEGEIIFRRKMKELQ